MPSQHYHQVLSSLPFLLFQIMENIPCWNKDYTYTKISNPQKGVRSPVQPQTLRSEHQSVNRSHGKKHPSKKEKLRNQHLDPQSTQNEITGHQYKNTNKNNQSNKSLPGYINPARQSQQNSNIVYSQLRPSLLGWYKYWMLEWNSHWNNSGKGWMKYCRSDQTI